MPFRAFNAMSEPKQVSVSLETLETCQNWGFELEAAWRWKANEPRNRNKADYEQLVKELNTLTEIIQTAKASEIDGSTSSTK
jgi:hypothetical protein